MFGQSRFALYFLMSSTYIPQSNHYSIAFCFGIVMKDKRTLVEKKRNPFLTTRNSCSRYAQEGVERQSDLLTRECNKTSKTGMLLEFASMACITSDTIFQRFQSCIWALSLEGTEFSTSSWRTQIFKIHNFHTMTDTVCPNPCYQCQYHSLSPLLLFSFIFIILPLSSTVSIVNNV